MKVILLIGRILYGLFFIATFFRHFSSPLISYATDSGVPSAHFIMPLWGVLAFLGGLSILLGYKARVGAWLLVIYLVPMTLIAHHFWTVTDPIGAMLQKGLFMRNIALLGSALMITYFGSGPLSKSKD